MTTPVNLYRLWRTSAVMCTLGAVEFGYLWWIRREWWLVLPISLLILGAGLAFRKAKGSR